MTQHRHSLVVPWLVLGAVEIASLVAFGFYMFYVLWTVQGNLTFTVEGQVDAEDIVLINR